MLRWFALLLCFMAPLGCQPALAQQAQQQAIISAIRSQLDALSKNIDENQPTPTPTPDPDPPPPAKLQPVLATPIAGKTWEVTFADEFTGSKLDTTKWNYLPHWGTTVVNGGLGNTIGNGGQLEFSGNVMTLRANRQPDQRWNTSVITTMGKANQIYGFFEMRAKLPKGSGAWPGFWLMREDKVWPDGEVDIMESNGNWPKLWAPNYHWVENGQHESAAKYWQGNGDLSEAFHVYGCNWQNGRLDYYFDGKLEHSIVTPGVMKVPMYMLLSLEISNGGSSWPAPNASTPNPMRYEVDYVRAWK